MNGTDRFKARFDLCARCLDRESDGELHEPIAYLARKVLHEQPVGNQLTLAGNFGIVELIDKIQVFLTRQFRAGRMMDIHASGFSRKQLSERDSSCDDLE